VRQTAIGIAAHNETEGHMRACPNCGHQFGRTTEKGFCSFVCKVSFNARQKAYRAKRRREGLRKLLAHVQALALPGQQLGLRETSPHNGR
jgi:hypothetical protein